VRTVDYELWAPFYGRIQAEFGYRMEAEQLAADRLLTLLPESARVDPLGRVAARLAGRDAVVVGLAPRAGPPPVWKLPASTPGPAIVAADGAAERCLEAGLVPDVVVTDLDGPVPAEVTSNSRGSLAVLHAHGDNLDALERWVPEFDGELAGSWAGPPEPGLLDVGGFTDGDRGAYLAAHVGARRVLLWGFEFDQTEEIEPLAHLQKVRKLHWAAESLELLARGTVPILRWRPDGSLAASETGPSTH
jgi:2-amino-4-hydroxy-6-hydroxymethyldihydropteridine diphosphokinase